jgi:phenylalanine-4-hydroxylase
VRKIREGKTGYERLGEIWETQQAEHPEDWLLSMEIFEILNATDQQPELKEKIENFLNDRKAKSKDLSTLISWGFRLVEYHKKPEHQAALQVSPK